MALDFLPHLFSGANPFDDHSAGSFEGSGSGHQKDACASPPTSLGESVAHLARGAIADIAHGVQRLLSSSGGDQHSFTLEIFPNAKGLEDNSGNRLNRRQASGTRHPAGEITLIWIDHLRAARTQRLQVL